MSVTLKQLRDYPWEYASRCLKIADKQSQLVPFKWNPCQKKIWRAIEKQRAHGMPPRIIILKSRQVGCSTFAQALMFHACHLFPHRTALVLAHKIESAEVLFEISKRFYDNLPEQLRFKRKYSTKRRVHFDKNDSKLQVEVAGEVRGYTAQLVHLSELAFYQDAEATLGAILQTVPANPKSLVIIESTPNGASGEFYKTWRRAKRGESGFEPIFIPWFQDDGYEMPGELVGGLTDEERELRDRYTVTEPQLVWRRWCIDNNCGGDPDRFLQEYPSDDESCFLHSGRPVYDVAGFKHYHELSESDVAKSALANVYEIQPGSEPKHPFLVSTRGGRLRVYFQPEARHQYVVGVDPSAGDPGSDPSPAIVVDRHTLNVAAVWHGRTPPEQLARIASLLGRYYNGALVVGEANNHGILFLHELADQYDNIYYRGPAPDSVSGASTNRLGYYTSIKTRDHVINVTRKYVRERLGLIYDPTLVDELRTMVYDDADKAQAAEGSHDDCVMAFGIALEAHKGHPDATLAPLPLSTLQEADWLRQRRVMLGLDDGDPAAYAHLGVTCEDMERFDEQQEKRRLRREALGLDA